MQHRTFANRDEAQRAIFEFIEGWYNPQRRHSALDYDSPLGYERKHTAGPRIEVTARKINILSLQLSAKPGQAHVVAIARQQPPDEALAETPLQQLLKAVERFHASRGILVTTGQIPQELKQTAQASDASIELIDGHLLRKMAHDTQVPPD